MKNPSLLRNQLLLLGAVTVVFLAFGLYATFVTSHFQNSPALLVARMMSELKTKHNFTYKQTLDLIKSANSGVVFPMQAELVGQQRAQELTKKYGSLPSQSLEMKEYGANDAFEFPFRIVKLPSEANGENIYLDVVYRPRANPVTRFLNLQTGVLMTSIFLAAVFSILCMFYFIRKKAELAAAVIAKLREGDLSARFPISKMDEVGQLMGEFNRMAEQIQTLVEGIRNSDLARMRRLQELAHDLRTPVASLKNLIETLQSHRGDLPASSQEELLNLSLKEVEYFQRLVEDVLFLAQVRDPKYMIERSSVSLPELLDDELETMKARYPNIHVVSKVAPNVSEVSGDTHLLRRLFRNAFENAFSFADSQVEVLVGRVDDQAEVIIRDDGPGFNQSTLASFGEKRTTRFVSSSSEGRLSVGLGSVIMKEVVQVHNGSIKVRNHDHKHGAELQIHLSQNEY